MRKFLKSFLNKYFPKPIHAEHQEKIDYVYSALVVGMFVCFTVVFLTPFFYIYAQSFTFQNLIISVCAPLFLVFGCLQCYKRLQRIEIEKSLNILILFVIIAYSAAIFGSADGFYDPGVFASALVMTVVSSYASQTSLSVFTYASIAVLIIEFLLERFGIKVTLHPEPPLFHLIIYIIFILGCRWFLKSLVNGFTEQATELRNNRDDLEIYKNHLEQKVEDRTAQLSVEKNRAEEANSAKSKFLASMSHELRTPLNAIIGYSELIEEELVESNADPMATEDVTKVRTAAKNLLGLINNILDLSKVEANQTDFHIQKVTLQNTLDEIEALFMPIFQLSGNQFQIESWDTDLAVWTDPQKLKQILINLISNANKFTHEGSVVLSVKELAFDISISISDNGIGIKEDFIANLFEPFSQADGAYNREYGGTGLGLSITKRFIEKMEGSITVESQFGEGTTFVVYLPKADRSPLHLESVNQADE